MRSVEVERGHRADGSEAEGACAVVQPEHGGRGEGAVQFHREEDVGVAVEIDIVDGEVLGVGVQRPDERKGKRRRGERDSGPSEVDPHGARPGVRDHVEERVAVHVDEHAAVAREVEARNGDRDEPPVSVVQGRGPDAGEVLISVVVEIAYGGRSRSLLGNRPIQHLEERRLGRCDRGGQHARDDDGGAGHGLLQPSSSQARCRRRIPRGSTRRVTRSLRGVTGSPRGRGAVSSRRR